MFKKITFQLVLIIAIAWLSTHVATAQCEADFDYVVLGNNVNLYDVSTGSYTDRLWIVDGINIPSTEPYVEWIFTEEGFHNICLTVFDDQNCESTTCNGGIYYGDATLMCNYTDCVFPGDADGNGQASMFDLLTLSLGYEMMGPPRDDDGLAWEGVYAPNWDTQTQNGINHKHLDCNGDGIINEADVEGILLNYSLNDQPIPIAEPSAPTIWLSLEEDTIYVDENTPDLIPVTIKIMAADEATPISNLKGLAFSLGYSTDVVSESTPAFEYNPTSFLGDSTEVIGLTHDSMDEGVFDIGYARKWDEIGGYGEIGTLQIIIMGDIISARSQEYVPIPLSIFDLFGIDGNGDPVSLAGLDTELTIVVDDNITSTKNIDSSNELSIFPNPTSDEFTITGNWSDTAILEVYDTQGRPVLEQKIDPAQSVVPTTDWAAGIYFVTIQTAEAIVTERLVVR